MILIEDSRQQAGKHLNVQRYCDRHGIELIRKKLDVGDYMLEGGTVSVDTKFGMAECYSNLIQDHDRFRRECIRARDSGIRLVVLVEESGITTLEDIKEWVNPRVTAYERAVTNGWPHAKAAPISSKRLYGIMKTMAENYGIEWAFCHKNSTGKRIVEILTEGTDEGHCVDNGNDQAICDSGASC